MKYDYLTKEAIEAFIKSALEEDIQSGDHSTLASVPADAKDKGQILMKDEGVIAGLEMGQYIFEQVDPNLKVEIHFKDGDLVKKGDVVMNIEGSARSILIAERLVLNCMQRMSGIATHTRKIVDLLEGTKTQILDTRKTTPNFRMMEKWAVKIGGGNNHRYGLFDMVMLKDNHIDYSGSITKAVQQTQAYLKENNLDLEIEVETRDLDEVKEALEVGGVDVIMLDNMDYDTMKTAVQMIDGKCRTEASGGITIDKVRSVAECGVDFISLGALTHSSGILDISLKAVK
ncbi:carboxylating nicotinate-nucleotide diphosphorylase [Sediminitomix flava]|uniref:nicotinate-nucleotide diphosphorylase (carboxylating) n=1 Tax=Sediminitomix flava TaxID=379075 RepID=A0A315Z7C5_SEDFL|nr:carboxylating nicotinate-nucleotide diphosphorylase [Sediminitomix flava]PWJ39110.1 nicotinate-nucleotide pyrophosphorylase [carboxylating] [Sediminitomix flava]